MDNLTFGNSHISNQKQHLALRVALDTMKDRCILQQKRLSEVEEDNQQLRERLAQSTKTNSNASHNLGGVAENFQLRLQVSELQRQNLQLNAHINMVSTENRKLWQRLSQMAKDQSRQIIEKDATPANTSAVASDEALSPRSSTSGGNVSQNLIRSKTFTQHSPNPNLRHKLLSSDNCSSSEMLDVSLEAEVALEVFGDERGRQQPSAENDDSVTQVTMGFGYLNVDDSSSNMSPEQDFNVEARKCMQGLQEMRREAMKQQQDLNSVFALLESRIALQPCRECINKSHKPEMADKSLETDESLNDTKKYTSNTTANNGNLIYGDTSTKLIPLIQNNHLNIIQDKILADETNNMCPMCGKIYDSQVTFESFCEHVEQHFRDENMHDIDHSIEYNFELISHSVGDF